MYRETKILDQLKWKNFTISTGLLTKILDGYSQMDGKFLMTGECGRMMDGMPSFQVSDRY